MDLNPIIQISSGDGLGSIQDETEQVWMHLVVEITCKFYYSQNVK